MPPRPPVKVRFLGFGRSQLISLCSYDVCLTSQIDGHHCVHRTSLVRDVCCCARADMEGEGGGRGGRPKCDGRIQRPTGRPGLVYGPTWGAGHLGGRCPLAAPLNGISANRGTPSSAMADVPIARECTPRDPYEGLGILSCTGRLCGRISIRAFQEKTRRHPLCIGLENNTYIGSFLAKHL